MKLAANPPNKTVTGNEKTTGQLATNDLKQINTIAVHLSNKKERKNEKYPKKPKVTPVLQIQANPILGVCSFGRPAPAAGSGSPCPSP